MTSPRRSPVPLSGLTVVLPCRNDAAVLAALIHESASAAASVARSYEVVVVDDGSTDDSVAIVAGLAAAVPHVRLLVHARTRGYGDAVRTGISAASMEWVLLVDDAPFALAALPDLARLAARADAIWGWRDGAAHRVSTACWTATVRALFGVPVHDVDCGCQLIRREFLETVVLRSHGAMLGTELAVRCRAAGARLAESRVHGRGVDRDSGSRHPHGVLRAVPELLSLQHELRRLPRSAA